MAFATAIALGLVASCLISTTMLYVMLTKGDKAEIQSFEKEYGS